MRVLDRVRWRFFAGSRDFSRVVLSFVAVAYVTRVIAARWRSDFSVFFPDSSSYIAVAKLGPFDPAFWFSDRPVGVPVVLWLTGGNHRVFYLVQTVVFALSLTYLCSTLLKVVAPRWLAWISVGAVTSISVHPRFGLWHLEILSESLALSLSLVLVASWLRHACAPSRGNLVIATVATLAWMSVRDVHIVTGLVIAIALAVDAAVRKFPWRRSSFMCSAALVAFCGYVLVAQSASDRNLYPLINNVGERVLPDAEVRSTFVDRGMPLDEALLERSGADSWSDDQTFLVSDDLAEFRAWADSEGQRALLTSLVSDASYWVDTTRNGLDQTLPLDFTEYDRYATSDRLPTRLLWLQGPRSTTQLGAWLIAGVAALLVLVASSFRRSSTRRPMSRHESPPESIDQLPLDGRTRESSARRLALVGLVALIAAGADVYVSASGDSVEVQRHLLGPIFRLTLVLVVMVVLAAREIVARVALTRGKVVDVGQPRVPTSFSASLALSLAAVAIFGSWVALEHRSQDFDPQYARTIVERAARFGGSYYENGIHNKGPLETLAYDSVRLFTGFDTFWFGISAYVVVIALLLGWTAWAIVRRLELPLRTVLAPTAGALVAVHFALSDADYAGVLYSRNITTAILSLVVALTIWDRPWLRPRRATFAYLTVFVLLGLAVQTLLTTVFAATVVGTYVQARRAPATALTRPVSTSLIVAAASIATAPLWYAVRGSFAEFWSSWWTYAGYMSSSTGRSLLDQIGLGGQKILGYYQERPGIALLIFAFVFLLRRAWHHLSTSSRTLYVMLAAWLVAGWIELVLSQRYSSHYFSVVAVPTAFIAAATAVLVAMTLSQRDPDLREGVRRVRRSFAIPIACVLALLASQGTHLAWIAIEGAGAFRSTDHYVRARQDARSGTQETRQAVFDLVSADDDPLLAWTMYPWTYLDHRRVPATRFSWKSFLIGEIYLARTSSDYVLDRTWEWFADDLVRTEPQIYARPLVTAFEPTTPFKDFVDRNFTVVYTDDEIEIGWRRELWDSVTPVSPSRTSTTDSFDDLPSGWTFDSTESLLTARVGAQPWVSSIESCSVVSMRIVRRSSADPMGITFEFAPMGTDGRSVSLSADFDRAWSMRNDGTGVDASTELHATVLAETDRTVLDVGLVVAARTAALIIDGEIVAAAFVPENASISIVPSVDTLSMTPPNSERLSLFTGC